MKWTQVKGAHSRCRASRSTPSVCSFYLCPFYWKPTISGVSLEFPGLENIPQVPGNEAEVGQNYHARNVVSSTVSVLKWSMVIFRPTSSKVRLQKALQWNGHSQFFWTHTFEILGRNIAPLHFKKERVAETDLRAFWFWATSARFADDLALQFNEYSKTFWALTFELVGRNITTLYFKTERVDETALRAS